ncbi:Cobyrinic acid A,C-diamide synthase [uncultured Candidatus Thioglobus sp.]|nr:Cobyrinic acid A,C-diamide synthase [uncultured Candidatus Thioglobus sp.]
MITITKNAAEEIGLSTQNPETQGLKMRFAVDKTDEGFQYLMGFDELAEGDIHLESNGVEYILSYAQKEFLQGMVVDFDEIDTEGGYGFIFMNPNDPNYTPPENHNAPEKI